MKNFNKDPRYEKISYYVIFSSVLIFLLYRIAAHFDEVIAFLGHGITNLIVILTPVFYGFILYYLLKPIVNKIEDKLNKCKYIKKNTRTLSVTITYILILLSISILVSMLLSAITKEIQFANLDSTVALLEGIANSMQAFYQELMNGLKSITMNSEAMTKWVDQIVSIFGTMINNFGSSLIANASNATSFITNLLLAMIFSIYFLADGANIHAYWSDVFTSLLPKKATDSFNVFKQDADIAFSGYIRGQLLDALLMAVMISIVLSLTGVKFAIVIGVLAGIGNLIPYVGPFVAYGLTILACLISNDLQTLVQSLIALAIIQAIDGQIINPKLLGSTVNVHPMYVIVAIIFGEALGGFMGMIFAVPVAALIKIEFDRYIAYRKTR